MGDKEFTLSEKKVKMSRYCAYQDRCNSEVVNKLMQINASQDEIDEIIRYLTREGFLDEMRYSVSFARGKLVSKKWGRLRIMWELKKKDVNEHAIRNAMRDIEEDCEEVFQETARRKWETIDKENMALAKNKLKQFLLYRGWENDRINKFMKEEIRKD